MKERRRFSLSRSVVIFVSVGIAALLVPVGVQAAATLVRLQDANSSTLAQIDGGSVRVADGPSEPFQGELETSVSTSGFHGTDSFVVPAGKRLVIDNVTFFADLPDGQRFYRVVLTTTAAGVSATHGTFPISFNGGIGTLRDVYGGSFPARIYADPSTTVQLAVTRSPSGGTATMTAAISGHLIPV